MYYKKLGGFLNLREMDTLFDSFFNTKSSEIIYKKIEFSFYIFERRLK